ncbi:hypothetical protein AB0M05_28810 [Streptomyces violaceusniger]|uniref:hypothetical protein n=1 Tax=Streptomyces violaceusniger TaxID=68280 RepID=UPI003445CEBA
MAKVGLDWDAVRAPVEIGERALALLGDATGAVIADYAQMYWLIAAGSAQHWRRLPQVQALSEAPISYIGIPPISRTTGPTLHWRVPLGPDCYLTDNPLLRGALAQAIAAELGTDREVGR